jgi:hypothetical protein
MNSLIRLRTMLSICVASAVGCFALLPRMQAVSPSPDGGYAGGNTAEGQNALLSLTSGTFNTAVGVFSLLSNTEGNFNTAVGAGTLLANVGNPGAFEGVQNTAIGAGALLSNTIGEENTAIGAFALFSTTEGGGNTASGDSALFRNTTGNSNTATGSNTLFGNTTGAENTATGAFALISNTEGNRNTATGSEALANNTTGFNNTATSAFALHNNTTGHDNTASGLQVLLNNTTGSFNTAVGRDALGNNIEGDFNTATGFNALRNNTAGVQNTANGTGALGSNTTGSGNIALGVAAGSDVTDANNVICIGHPGANVDDSCFIGQIRDALVAPDAAPVLIDSAGKLGTTSGSSRRFKKEIKSMSEVSEAIFALKPVTFRYKTDNTNTTQFGLIAEEVAVASPDLVVRDKGGELLTVRYEAVNAMLLNEFLKEHRIVKDQNGTLQDQARKIEEQEATIAQLKKGMETLVVCLKEQDAKIQKVSAQVEISRPAPQLTRNKTD